MTDQFRNITFPAEDDGFFAELREEVNACLLYTSDAADES